jgi:hypothetical protein
MDQCQRPFALVWETTAASLLAVIGQDFLARLAQSGAVLFQAGQNDHIAVIHHGTAMAHHIPRTGIGVFILRRGRRSRQNEGQKNRNDWKKSGHFNRPSNAAVYGIKKLVPQTGLEPVTPSLRMTCSTN